MTPSTNAARDTEAARELVITRVYEAPRELVFKAWSAPEHQARWMGPKGFTAPVNDMDFRVGGAYRNCIRSPEGKEFWWRGVYREIVEPERLVFTFGWEGEDGGEPMPDTLVTLTFSETDGRTTMTFRQGPFPSQEERDSHAGGWNEAFDKLGAYLVR
jgi:uncharacterized protein YndB with AHSA1/START domain